MITFSSKENYIFLNYTPEFGQNWINTEISRRSSITLK
jgi:hypothetical protein